MFAFNESPYRGAYMTDVIKGEVEAKAGNLLARIRTGTVAVAKHVDTFRAEMHDVGVREHALFILFGKDAADLFRSHLAGIYPNHVKCPHYSMYGKGWTDAEWVDKAGRSWKGTSRQQNQCSTLRSLGEVNRCRIGCRRSRKNRIGTKKSSSS